MSTTAICLAEHVRPETLERVLTSVSTRCFVALNEDFRTAGDFVGWRNAVEGRMGPIVHELPDYVVVDYHHFPRMKFPESITLIEVFGHDSRMLFFNEFGGQAYGTYIFGGNDFDLSRFRAFVKRQSRLQPSGIMDMPDESADLEELASLSSIMLVDQYPDWDGCGIGVLTRSIECRTTICNVLADLGYDESEEYCSPAVGRFSNEYFIGDAEDLYRKYYGSRG